MDFTSKVRDSILDPRVVWDILKVLYAFKVYTLEVFCQKYDLSLYTHFRDVL